jgi:hypothetical protein
MNILNIIGPSRRRFNPLSLSPAIWLDASDASTLYDATTGGSLVAVDGEIARWEDKSGNSRHMTQTASASRPLRKSALQNGKDVALFDGTNDFMLVDTGATISQPATVIAALQVLANPASVNGRVVHASTLSASEANLFLPIGYDAGTDSRILNFGNNISYSNRSLAAQVWSVVANGASSGAWVNGALLTGSINPGANGIGRYFSIGGRYHDGLRTINMRLFEILVFSAGLSSTDLTAVESYLNAKWAIF